MKWMEEEEEVETGNGAGGERENWLD